MSDVRKKAELLRDENERLAREAEREMIDPGLTEEQRKDASDRAKAHWQFSRGWADTVANAADARPKKFTGKNTGKQPKTKARQEFLRKVSTEIGSTKRQDVANAAWKRQEAKQYFDNYEALYRFFGRKDIF